MKKKNLSILHNFTPAEKMRLHRKIKKAKELEKQRKKYLKKKERKLNAKHVPLRRYKLKLLFCCCFLFFFFNRGILMNIALEDRIKISVFTVRVVPFIMFMRTRVLCLFFLTVIRTRISVLSRSERFI